MKDLIDAVAAWKNSIMVIREHKMAGKKKYYEFYTNKDKVDNLVAACKGTAQEEAAIALADVQYKDLFPKHN